MTDRLITVVGPCDSGKTTVLDAIGLVATPRIAVTFDDNDFYEADTSEPFTIEATLGEVPRPLLSESRFGLDLGGIDESGRLHDEPGDLAPTLTVRLAVDASLEPAWTVVSSRSPDGRPISARDRAQLGVVRLGSDPDRQFTWSRGSALARSSEEAEELPSILSAAYRDAREAVAETDVSGLDNAIASARTVAIEMGAGRIAEDLTVRLVVSPTSGAGLTLHGHGIPLAAAGLGTRRLLALGLELHAAPYGALVCLDELEHGLEPHRVRHVIRALRAAITERGGQLICTTHSPIVLEELGADGVHVVKENQGQLTCERLPAELTPLARSNPHAFLARRVLIGEGKTEVGLVRGFERNWSLEHDGKSLAYEGVALVVGGGRTKAPPTALAMNALGYPTLVLADSDEPLEPGRDELVGAGVQVVQWADKTSTELRAALDVSWDGLCALFSLVVEFGHDSHQIVDALLRSPSGSAVLSRLGLARSDCGADFAALRVLGFGDEDLRRAFGEAAHASDWFKRVDVGEALGTALASDSDALTNNIGAELKRVSEWCFGDDAG